YLVNDLDLRIEFEDGTVFFPWILDPANPANAATTGDNTRDNVEQILISAPDSGLYEIRVVSPAGASTQDFSLILQGNDAIENRYISNAVLLEDTLFTARNLVEFGPNVMIGDTGIVQAIGGHCVRLLPGVDIVPVESGMFRAYIQKGGLCAYYDDAAGADLGGPVSGLSVLDLGDDSAGSQSAENGQQEISEEVELEPASIFQVFPNPATDRVFFRIELQEAGAVDLVVYDEMGRPVHQMRSDGYTPAGTLNYELSLSQLEAGMYYCVLSTERDRLVEKLVVLRR
ncbi:MAG: T9SS type A sorting domain-containing protein, partial [Saprospiraceae bacterium]|nr:T9SS type A sorting domain-containing protein [Saprospiraceae bacterium]